MKTIQLILRFKSEERQVDIPEENLADAWESLSSFIASTKGYGLNTVIFDFDDYESVLVATEKVANFLI